MMISTQGTLQEATGPIRIGKSRTHKPVIEHGFLMFEDHKGSQAGINLADVSIFSIEPEYEE
ncbi:hypothetical protein [Salmonella sp. ZJHZ21_0198]|uniref:hypothetical protein n=1 Tax=Salmonella sp. ZJHZ21_0198 TaxID=3159605 RepID=UPI0039817D7C